MSSEDDPFSDLVAAADGAMVIVTAATKGTRSGCLVGFHTQSSIQPERYSVWLSKANHTYRVALLATHFAVHFLTENDRDLAKLFGTSTGDDIDKFEGCNTELGPGGAPLLVVCPNRLVLRRTALVEVEGDHVCFVGEPVRADNAGSFTPLRLGDVSDLDPGHKAEERPLATGG